MSLLDNGPEIGRVSRRALRFIMSSLNFPELFLGDGKCYRGLENFGGRVAKCDEQFEFQNFRNVNKLSKIIAKLYGHSEHFMVY